MARTSEFDKWKNLRNLIADAISCDLEDQGLTEDDLFHVYFVVSPDLDEVIAWVNIRKSEIDIPAFDGWHLEYAESMERAVAIADLYFDLR